MYCNSSKSVFFSHSRGTSWPNLIFPWKLFFLTVLWYSHIFFFQIKYKWLAVYHSSCQGRYYASFMNTVHPSNLTLCMGMKANLPIYLPSKYLLVPEEWMLVRLVHSFPGTWAAAKRHTLLNGSEVWGPPSKAGVGSHTLFAWERGMVFVSLPACIIIWRKPATLYLHIQWWMLISAHFGRTWTSLGL